MKNFLFAIALLMVCCSDSSTAQTGTTTWFSVNSMLGSSMVIQRESILPIFGNGSPNATIKIICSWEIPTKIHSTKCSEKGKWEVFVKTPTAGGPHTITIVGDKTITFDQILSGDVWLCSGQSNMQWSLRDSENGLSHVMQANNPKIRLFDIQKRTQSEKPQETIDAMWMECTPETAAKFSAIGYHFGCYLADDTAIPIGLINSSWGSTAIETWMERSSVMDNPIFSQEQELRETAGPDQWGGPYKAGYGFNAMIYPLHRFPIAGVIWYQGENNYGSKHYDGLLETLITSWRKLWGREFSFFIAQTCPYKKEWVFKTGYANSNMRYMQLMASKRVAKSGVTVNDDIAEINDIHPKNKLDVGKRLAWLALNKHYKIDSNSAMLCPVYSHSTVNDGSITVYFDNAPEGLKTRDNQAVSMVEIAGENKIFYPAEAIISGNSLTASAANVTKPKYIRLGWSYTRITNLTSQQGLPVSVFRSYDWFDENEEAL